MAALAAGLFPELIPFSDRPPRLILFLIAAGMLLFAFVSLFTFRARLRLSNWLVRFDRRKLYIKFRSYLNAHLPEDDPVVAVLDPDEIEWNGPRTRIRPSADRAIAILGRSFRVLPELRLREEGIRDLDPEEAEARIRKHVEKGEILAAAKLARRLHGLSLTEARQYVEQLRAS